MSKRNDAGRWKRGDDEIRRNLPPGVKLVRTLRGHLGWVSNLAWSTDGELLASSSRDKTIRLWSNLTGECILTLEGHRHTVMSVAFSPVDNLLASGSHDSTVCIWNLSTGSITRVLEGHYGRVYSLCFSHTGNILVSAGDDGTMKWWDVQTGSLIRSNDAGRHGITALRLDSTGRVLASSSLDGTLKLWDASTGARNDRGGVSVSKDRLNSVIEEFSFDSYFETSAKEGWQIKELKNAIEVAIPWKDLPVVSSSQLFADIKGFLLEMKQSGRLLAPVTELFQAFIQTHPIPADGVPRLREQFETCIGRLENRDLIRRLTFGGYVLLQPELLDAYASAMVNTAKDEPDGLGSLAEEIALLGRFFVPKEQKVADSGQEQLLLHATVEELVRHELALRESADDGRYLVFPTQFNRDYEDAPEPKGKAVAITFDGPVQSLYATLAVRLGHSGLFSIGRAEMWRNAAVFTAKTGGKCGLFLQEFAEARGRLILFYDSKASPETRFHFEEFAVTHTKRRALDNSVSVVRFHVCSSCSEPVPDAYVKMLRSRGTDAFSCPCGGRVSLVEPKDRVQFRSRVESMDRTADNQRDFDAFVVSAKGETSTERFRNWAGGERVTLAIVFTDIVGSTALGQRIGDEAMTEVRRAHFSQSRILIDRYRGQEVKTIGDSFMAAFKSVDAALDYAKALQQNTGHQLVRVRAGIHIGSMQVDEGDVFGGTVNFAARVVGAVQNAEIWLSDRAKDDIDRLGASKYRSLRWKRHAGVSMKGFQGEFVLWSIVGEEGRRHDRRRRHR